MFITKKKLQSIEKRIADLEGLVQSQQKVMIENTKLAGLTKKIGKSAFC